MYISLNRELHWSWFIFERMNWNDQLLRTTIWFEFVDNFFSDWISVFLNDNNVRWINPMQHSLQTHSNRMLFRERRNLTISHWNWQKKWMHQKIRVTVQRIPKLQFPMDLCNFACGMSMFQMRLEAWNFEWITFSGQFEREMLNSIKD